MEFENVFIIVGSYLLIIGKIHAAYHVFPVIKMSYHSLWREPKHTQYQKLIVGVHIILHITVFLFITIECSPATTTGASIAGLMYILSKL